MKKGGKGVTKERKEHHPEEDVRRTKALGARDSNAKMSPKMTRAEKSGVKKKRGQKGAKC